MIFTFTFLTSFLVIAGLFGYHYFLLKTKRIGEPTTDEENWVTLRGDHIRGEAEKHGRYFTHRFVLLMLKIWIKVSYFVRKYDQALRGRVTSFLHHNAQEMNKKKHVSSFLTRIKEHKETIRNEGDNS